MVVVVLEFDGRLEDACGGTGGGESGASCAGEGRLSTSLLVYGSHTVAVEEWEVPFVSIAACSALPTLVRGVVVPQA